MTDPNPFHGPTQADWDRIRKSDPTCRRTSLLVPPWGWVWWQYEAKSESALSVRVKPVSAVEMAYGRSIRLRNRFPWLDLVALGSVLGVIPVLIGVQSTDNLFVLTLLYALVGAYALLLALAVVGRFVGTSALPEKTQTYTVDSLTPHFADVLVAGARLAVIFNDPMTSKEVRRVLTAERIRVLVLAAAQRPEQAAHLRAAVVLLSDALAARASTDVPLSRVCEIVSLLPRGHVDN